MLTLDSDTVEAIAVLRVERNTYGPWMLNVGDRPVNPERVTAWWRRARRLAGLDEPVFFRALTGSSRCLQPLAAR